MMAGERTQTGRNLNMKMKGLVFALFLLVTGGVVYGQAGDTGTILGTVTDSSGAVVADAKVQITNIATGITTDARTSGNGDYTAPYLKPGTYKITVEASGFEKSVVNDVSLAVAQDARINVTLKPGAVNLSIEVQANAVALDTETSSVSQLVSQQQVEQLPLNGRNFLSLLFIGAGAVQTTGEQGQMRQGEGNAISINGGRPTSNNYTLDGLVNTDTSLNTPAVILSQDAIQEFKVQSETYSAEYGFSANQINIVSKSGTNQLHGTAFEFLRNDAFDARSTFQTTIPELRQNQFGLVLGGPIYVPKVYDGRNKTFFLVNYEGWRIRNGTNGFFNVPDPAQLSGDFSNSGLLTVAQGCVPSATTFCMPVDPNTGQPFPGNKIDSSRFSRLAQVGLAAKLFPAPNCLSSGCLGNFRLNTTLANTVDQQTYKLDQNLGRFGSVFFRYTKAQYSNQNINGSTTVPFGIGIFNEQSNSWQISHTITLWHNNVNNFRFGHLDPSALQGGNPAPASDVTALGLTGVFQNLPSYARLYPSITLQGLANTGFGSQVNDATTSDVPVWEFADSLSLIRGKHTVTVGVDYRRWVSKRNLSSDFLGHYTFQNDTILNNGSSTGFRGEPANGCATVTCGTGNSIADMLLGYYHDVSTFLPGPFSPSGVAGNLNKYHFQYLAPFVQDDWKVTSKLTVNLGLRWDYRSVPYEETNKMFWFDLANPKGGLCFADQKLGTSTVSGLGGPIAPDGNGFYRYCGRNNPADGSKKPFAPRIGFAWRPFGNKTVVRGGYGLFFDSAETREIDDSGDIYPFVVRAADNATTDATLPKLTNNMFPPVPLHQVTPAIDGSQFFAVIISERPRNPYVQQWSLSVQRELARDTTLEVNYVGNKGTHLLNRFNIGQPVPPANPTLCDPSTGGSPTAADCPAAVRRPFANITSANGFLDSEWNGYSNYNAANVKLERRTSSMAIVAVYTWAKSMDDKSAAAGVGATNAFAGHMDEHNPSRDYGLSDFDVPQRFVTSFVYQLPVGRGRRFLSSANKAVDLIAGGWQVTGITTFQKGFPFSVLAADKLGLLTSFTQRANQIGQAYPSGFQKSINEWFNTAAFTQPLAGQFGSSGRNILRQPGINNWDVGLGKTLNFTERIGFQFRAEAFNVFNHTQYGYDPFTSTGIGSSVDNNPNDPQYGKVIAARPGRILQLGAKFVF
jgi:outer membrane receptor protein involved in Fe transport